MDKIDENIQTLREMGGTEAMRQVRDLEYNGRVDPDEDPIMTDDADEDEEDDRLPSERFYNPRREY